MTMPLPIEIFAFAFVVAVCALLVAIEVRMHNVAIDDELRQQFNIPHAARARVAYDPALALDLAEHAVAVYDLSNGYERWCRNRGFSGADTIVRGCTQIGIAYQPERIVIAARGSSQLGDWLDDFLPFRVRWITRTYADGHTLAPGRIHLGFRTQIERVAIELIATVRELRQRYPDAVVQVTGHSLGAALASLIRVLLEHDYIPVDVTYTFESPRVGNATWAQWYDASFGDNSFRVANVNAGEQDIVTRVPLSRLGWRHVGRPIILCGGKAFESETRWEQYRHDNPISVVDHLRVIRRAWRSVSAHLGGSLLAELRRNPAILPLRS